LIEEAEKFRIKVYDNLIISGRDYVSISWVFI
jgi:hypothetical protein